MRKRKRTAADAAFSLFIWLCLFVAVAAIQFR